MLGFLNSSLLIRAGLAMGVITVLAVTGMASAVYMARSNLDETELVQPGSLLDYAYYHKLPEGFDADAWKDERRESFRNESMRMTTIEDQKENLDEAFASLNYFLNLVALVSLLLGCIGVASSVMIYIM